MPSEERGDFGVPVIWPKDGHGEFPECPDPTGGPNFGIMLVPDSDRMGMGIPVVNSPRELPGDLLCGFSLGRETC